MRPACSITGCQGPRWAQGWCQKHYRRWSRTGDPLGSIPRKRKQHCNSGHELAGQNLYIHKTDGSRRCRRCARDARRRQRAQVST